MSLKSSQQSASDLTEIYLNLSAAKNKRKNNYSSNLYILTLSWGISLLLSQVSYNSALTFTSCLQGAHNLPKAQIKILSGLIWACSQFWAYMLHSVFFSTCKGLYKLNSLTRNFLISLLLPGLWMYLLFAPSDIHWPRWALVVYVLNLSTETIAAGSQKADSSWVCVSKHRLASALIPEGLSYR